MKASQPDFLFPVAFAIDSALLIHWLASAGWSLHISVRIVVAFALWIVLLVGTALWLWGLIKGDER